MNNPIIDQLNILNQIKLLIHSAALPESGCCCCDYHSEKSLYLLVQLQLHTSLAKKKVAGNTLLTLVHIKKMLYSTLEKCRLIENFISWTWKFWVGINFPTYFVKKKDQFRNSYLLPKGGKREGILPKRYFLRTNIRSVFDRNLKDPSFKNRKFTVEIMY